TTWGYNATGGAFDIAVLQAKYGANPTQGAGHTTYVLPDTNEQGTFYVTIWDVSGVDEIVHDGSGSARIDLTAATLDYSPTGAGVVSYVGGIYGGFTIANGVVIENAKGGSDADILIGNTADNFLDGRGGADKLIGGAGNDSYGVDSGSDVITENDRGGTDRVVSSINYTLGRNLENLTLTGTAVSGTGNAAANAITGNDMANWLRGKEGVDVLTGGLGNDMLYGGTGADEMIGGLGRDNYFVDNAGDNVVELGGQGFDTVTSTVDYVMTPSVEQLILAGTADIDGTGNGLGNRMVGNSGANRLDGGNGRDTLEGMAGDDELIGDSGNDVLRGNAGVDSLSGGTGNDKLFGGTGNDELRGGAGFDRFYFDVALDPDQNVDVISGFVAADDAIFLNRSVFTGLSANGSISAAAFRAGTEAADANDRIVYDSATGNIFYDADGNGDGEAILFAKVDAGTVLTHADFIGYI
ncbi:MAG: M10 family metallopeptidase C-terminal domain-containing protein, partial [Pseudomonadota bacterium]|nr:M10 family metallopeptidase C-terminal domain-containing protein [Pseudomonadota bacterium]